MSAESNLPERRPIGERSATEIRDDIELHRDHLGRSVGQLRRRVTELTDVRGQIEAHRAELLAGATIAGLAVGGYFYLRSDE